jgi:hypothetical protein
MEGTPFTARNAAKFVLKAVVASKTKQVSEEIITDYTHFEEDDTVVTISGTLIGWYVSEKLQPVTDKIVDKSADFISRKRAERAAKKEQQTEDEKE